MKLPKFKILLILSFIFQLSIAQEVKWGTPVTPKPTTGDVVSLGWHDGFLYNLQIGSVWTNIGLSMVAKDNIRLEKVSKNAEVIFTKDLSKEGAGDIDSYTQYTALIKDGEVRVFYIVEKRGQNMLKSITYDLEGNLKKNGTVHQYHRETCFSKLFKNRTDQFAINKFSFSISPNDLKIGVTSVCLARNNQYEITTVVFNADGSEAKVHKNSFNTVGNITRFINRQLAVDDDGNAMFNYNIQEFKPKVYTKNVLATSKEGEVLSNRQLGRDDGSINYDDIFIKFSKNNEAYMAGAAKVSESDKSIFFTKFDLAQLGTMEFPTYFKNDKLILTEPKHRGAFYFDIKFGENGKGFLILNLIDSEGIGSGTIQKNYGLLVFPFDAKAKLNNYSLVPRLSKFNGFYIEPYPSCVKNGKLYLLYDDHEENVNFDKVEQMKTLMHSEISAIYLATISADNVVTRKILWTEKELKGDLHLVKNQESDTGFLINLKDAGKGMYGKRVLYGKVDF